MTNYRVRDMQGTPAHIEYVTPHNGKRRSRKKCKYYREEHCCKMMTQCVGPHVCTCFIELPSKGRTIW